MIALRFTALLIFVFLLGCSPKGFSYAPISDSATSRNPFGQLLKVSGDVQSLQPGQTATQSLTVQAIDLKNNPVFNQTVSFSIVDGNGALTNGGATYVATTDVNGYATVSYTAGGIAGMSTISAQSAMGSVTFTENIESYTNYTLISNAAGNNQSGTIATLLGSPIKATVLNSLSVPVAGASVNFTCISAPICGTFSSGSNPGSTLTVLTDASGVATVNYTLGGIAGTNTVQAALLGSSSINTLFTETGYVNVGSESPSLARSTITLSKPTIGTGETSVVTITLFDQYGNLIPDPNQIVTATLGIPTGGALITPFTYVGGVYTGVITGGGTAATFTVTGNIGGLPITSSVPTLTVQSWLYGVTIDCNNIAQYENTDLYVNNGTLTINSVDNGSGCAAFAGGPMPFRSLTIGPSGVVTHSVATATDWYGIDIVLTHDLTIQPGGHLSADGVGYLGGNGGLVGGRRINQTLGPNVYIGGEYGGTNFFEGVQTTNYAGPGAYGNSAISTIWPGAGGGGGGGNLGGNGGGFVRVRAANVLNNGSISATGQNGVIGGSASGSGGTVWLEITSPTGTLSGSGNVSANGGGYVTSYSSGSGGRIAIYCDGSVNCDSTYGLSNYQVNPGVTYAQSGTHYGTGGTIYRATDCGYNTTTFSTSGCTPSPFQGTQTLNTALNWFASDMAVIDSGTNLTIPGATNEISITGAPNIGQSVYGDLIFNGGTHVISQTINAKSITISNAANVTFNAAPVISGDLTILGSTLTLSAGSPASVGGNLYIQNSGVASTTNLNSQLNVTGNLQLSGGGVHTWNGKVIVGGDMAVSGFSPGGATTITSSPTGNSPPIYGVNLNVGGTLTIDPYSFINVDGKGFQGGIASAAPGGNGFTNGFTNAGGSSGSAATLTVGAGGSHGGSGGRPDPETAAATYDIAYAPGLPGSGGGGAFLASGVAGGNGGGVISVVAKNLALDGTISANGNTGAISGSTVGGGGAGGAIFIQLGSISGSGATASGAGVLTGVGIIRAKGGYSISGVGCGGGGGIISILGQVGQPNTWTGNVEATAGTTYVQSGVDACPNLSTDGTNYYNGAPQSATSSF